MSVVKWLIRQLAVVDENILAEAQRQPMLYVKAARYRVEKMRQKAQTEAELEYFTAERGLRVRANSTESKPTEGYIKSHIFKDKRYRVLRDAVDEATAREEFGKLLLKAYEMRKSAIEIVAYAQRAESMRGAAQVERNTEFRRVADEASEAYDKLRRRSREV